MPSKLWSARAAINDFRSVKLYEKTEPLRLFILFLVVDSVTSLKNTGPCTKLRLIVRAKEKEFVLSR